MASILSKELIEVNKCVKLWSKMSGWFIYPDGLVVSPKFGKSNTFAIVKFKKAEEDFKNFITDNVMAFNPDAFTKAFKGKVGDIGDFKRVGNRGVQLALEKCGKPVIVGVIDKSIESLDLIRREIEEKMKYFDENQGTVYQLSEEEKNDIDKGEEIHLNVGGNVIILSKVLIPGVNKKSDIIIKTVDDGGQTFKVLIKVTRSDMIDNYFNFTALKINV